MIALVSILLLASGTAVPVKDLPLVYRRACLVCHGADGSGKAAGGTRLPGRNLTDVRWQGRRSDEALIASILEGRDAMPSFRARMTREDAQRLVDLIIRPMATGRTPSRTKR